MIEFQSYTSDVENIRDPVIERSDRICHICEIKSSNALFTINKQYGNNLRNKLHAFSSLPINKRKTMFLTMISPFGVIQNEYCLELVQNEIVLEDLFTS